MERQEDFHTGTGTQGGYPVSQHPRPAKVAFSYLLEDSRHLLHTRAHTHPVWTLLTLLGVHPICL